MRPYRTLEEGISILVDSLWHSNHNKLMALHTSAVLRSRYPAASLEFDLSPENENGDDDEATD